MPFDFKTELSALRAATSTSSITSFLDGFVALNARALAEPFYDFSEAELAAARELMNRRELDAMQAELCAVPRRERYTPARVWHEHEVRAFHSKGCSECGRGFNDQRFYFLDSAQFQRVADKLCAGCLGRDAAARLGSADPAALHAALAAARAAGRAAFADPLGAGWAEAPGSRCERPEAVPWFGHGGF